MQDDEARLRAQDWKALMQMHALAGGLLGYGAALPGELRIRLDTFSADLAAVIEDKTGTSPAPHSAGDAGFLTVAEVAGMARVSRMTIYRLIGKGDLEAVRLARVFRIPEGAARKLMRGISQRPAEGPP